jgi:hypothetical protein
MKSFGDIKAIKEFTIDALHKGTVVVEFLKADGSVRKMTGTLDPLIISTYYTEPEVTKPRRVNEDVCKIFDLDKNEWRSFRWDRLQSVSAPFATVNNIFQLTGE